MGLSGSASKFNNTQISQGRMVQTIGRDANNKVRTQRSSSRGNITDLRGVRTDRRQDDYRRPDSRLENDSQLDGEESKLEGSSKFEGTMRLNPNSLGIGNTNMSAHTNHTIQ